jgi:hypothetical protein
MGVLLKNYLLIYKFKKMKLSLDALKERAEATASMDLLATISGGTDNACHDGVINNYQNATDAEFDALQDIGDHILQSIKDWWND